MSVRKRQWTTGKGVPKEAWVVDYADTNGKRRLKTFPRGATQTSHDDN
jgi:integrase